MSEEGIEVLGGSERRGLGLISEADLDMLLVLDAHTGGPLIPHLVRRSGLVTPAQAQVVRSTWRSAGSRQTDVEVTWPGGSLMVESKLEAGFTPGQPESYREEVERRRGIGEQAAAVLVCPARRTDGLAAESRDAFTRVVTCEELAEVAEAATADRFARAGALWLRAACETRPGEDPERSAWGDGYRASIAAAAPGAPVIGPGAGSLKTATATAAEYATAAVDPARVWRLGHHLLDGIVRMEVDAGDEHLIDLPPSVTIHRKPRMRWLDITVAPMTFDEPAAAQLDALGQALAAVNTLRAWAIQHLGHVPYEL